MAITTPELAGDGNHPIEKYAPWALNFHSADFTAGNLNQELKTAPGAGKATYITHVTMGLVDDSVKGYLIDARVTSSLLKWVA